jgi:hypothetical protein
MTDHTFRDVAPRYADWQAEERDIEDALDDDACNEPIIRLIGQERDALRESNGVLRESNGVLSATNALLRAHVGNLQHENAELRADRARLSLRLSALEAHGEGQVRQ